jgi:2-haloacid dehalogenase
MSSNFFAKEPAIVFDLGGVLIDWSPEHLYRKMFNGNERDMEYFLSVVCPLEWNEKIDAGRPFAEAVAVRSKEFPEYEPFIRAYHERWIEMVLGDFPQTVEILSALRDSGYPLCALSNWSAETYPLVKERFEFLDWFDDVIISGDVKMAKPDPAIFDLLIRRVNQPAGQCLFIDDNKRNILAAERAGLQTIHFSSAERLVSQLAERNIML